MKDIDFVNCVAYGKVAEYKVEELFLYDKIEYAPTKCAEYDVMLTMNDVDVFFEVKRDSRMDNTGNICIEYESNSKPSGIAVSKADYWVYFNHNMDEVYLIDTKYIRECIAKKKYHRNIKCGYGWLARAYLFDKEIFAKYRIEDV
jgi:hypothetical protein